MTDRVRKEQTFPASKWIFLLLIAFSALLTFQPAPASATAILTEELQLHIPWLSLENKVYAVDMTYSAGDNAFMLSGRTGKSERSDDSHSPHKFSGEPLFGRS
jgi:hypothetical protein